MMIKFRYAPTCLLIIASFVLKSMMATPVPPAFLESIKQKILSEIEKHPGTPAIMPQQWMPKERCVAKRFNQTIIHENCIPKAIENKFCYGQCNSFYISHITEKPIEVCSTCQPHKTFQEEVELDCVKDEQLYTHRITVVRIQSCRCKECP